MPNNSDGAGGWITPVLLGAVLGPTLQLQQPALWGLPAYVLLGISGLIAGAVSARIANASWRLAVVFATAALLAFSLCGWRAAVFAAQGIDEALEGRDLTVTGMVAAMPQRSETGVRFRLQVEAATAGGTPVRLPPQLYLGWYAAPCRAQATRWSCTDRLRTCMPASAGGWPCA
jgi:competence protein ComEC